MTGQNAQYDGVTVYRRLLGYVRPYWKIFLLAIAGMVRGQSMILYSATDRVTDG